MTTIAVIIGVAVLFGIAAASRNDNSPNWGNAGLVPIGCGVAIVIMVVVAVVTTAEHWGIKGGCDDTTAICSMLNSLRGR